MSCALSLAVCGNNRASKILRRPVAASVRLPVSKRANRRCAHAKAIQPHKEQIMVNEQVATAIFILFCIGVITLFSVLIYITLQE